MGIGSSSGRGTPVHAADHALEHELDDEAASAVARHRGESPLAAVGLALGHGGKVAAIRRQALHWLQRYASVCMLADTPG